MKIKLLGDRVLVKLIKEEQTKSGIVIPDTAAKNAPQKGEVVAVGKGGYDKHGNKVSMEIKKGDIILCPLFASKEEVKIDGKEYVIYRQDDIIAIL